MPNLDIIYDVTIAVKWNKKKTKQNKTINPRRTEFRHIPCFLLLSMAYNYQF